MIREYARNVESLTASAHEHPGESLTGAQPTLVVEHLDKHRWMIHTQESEWVCVQYRLYAREMSVRTNWVEHDYGFLTGAAAFPLYVVANRVRLWSCLNCRSSGPRGDVVDSQG